MTKRNIHEFNQNCKLLDIPALKLLASCFSIHQLVFVGGCVRDTILGVEPKDIDLATSATPEQMIEIFEAMDIHYIATGVQHGTLTAVVDDVPYEITTFRIDKETDGRHATVEFTRDINEDLMRRDLTINAIAMDFYGELIDPFGGIDDLNNGVVRFVGNPKDRIEEDYLRILRYFRFLGRFGSRLMFEHDTESFRAISEAASGLSNISVERIWSEVSKIISGSRASDIVSLMQKAGVWNNIGLPCDDDCNYAAFGYAERRRVKNPASIMAWYMPKESIEILAERWKWSNEERERAIFISSNVYMPEQFGDRALKQYKEMLVNRAPLDWVMDLAALHGLDNQKLATWTIPVMPVSGRDLIAAGVEPGPAMGRILDDIKRVWIDSDYSLDKDSLMCSMRF